MIEGLRKITVEEGVAYIEAGDFLCARSYAGNPSRRREYCYVQGGGNTGVCTRELGHKGQHAHHSGTHNGEFLPNWRWFGV